MFVFWFNTFFVDMHLLQQQSNATTSRPPSNHRTTANNVGGSDHRNPSVSSEAGTSSVTSHGSHSRSKGHHRQRSDTPGAPGGKSSKSHHSSHHQRAISPSTGKFVCLCPQVCAVMCSRISLVCLHAP